MSLAELLQPGILVPWLLGMVFGVFVGSTPGLTATMAVALIVPFSYHLEPSAGLAMIIGVSFTAIFSGDIPATYLRIPGTPASAAATLDGHAMARQNRGSLALTLDLFCSSLGGLVGVLILMTAAVQVARFAIRFTDFEYFWLAILGLSMSALVSQGSILKGVLAAAFGMLLATIGIDVVSGAQRFLFRDAAWIEASGETVQTFVRSVTSDLREGPQFIPVMIGLFGLAEVLRNLRRPASLESQTFSASFRPPIVEALTAIARNLRVFFQSAFTGALIGALPGAGADIAAWGAYGLAQKTSKNGDRFGEGEIEGVIAPTSANNAAVAGAWIPALVFSVPGDAVTAIVINAFRTYDIQTGPQLFEQSGDQVWAIFKIALITQLLLLPAGLIGIQMFGLLMRLPRRFVLAAVVVFSVVGSYALRNSMVDVWVMFVFGLVGYYLESQRVPLAPLILGLILGPRIEENLRVGLIKADGSLVPFFTRPISFTMVMLMALAFAAPLIARLMRRWRRAKSVDK